MTVTDALIAQLHPEVQLRCRALLEAATAVGILLCVTQGYRSPQQQAKLYAQGRAAPGAIVTRAPPGYSWHEYHLAFDVAVLHEGKATWPNDIRLWRRIGELGKATGLDWGGDFKTITDLPHFEYHPGLTLADARAGKTLPEPEQKPGQKAVA